ncbi:glycoside hydrolase family 38 N-terminal domain-containing protein [Phycisphaera mikurensis]|uniref:Putative alpha-mannosidase n=1 Tax=Phycisphaera mikurensis (strain NBRC 102666 / KCTC 22515 / FYK2301M01) TaxID=1142394 RepID=I0IBX9_PHYMF|nr:glycoside hydrolase family 38 C-terminal domain-containing protein [Phycisphaera mikurensis]MBB6442009.1 alpha-mannosidase/mannosylglycerate hydrolase [Phycisphaera mikurensis]BAM02767.1 putative alpha-mannosidase [Phycisphaera mikurensis NBRC 102666]
MPDAPPPAPRPAFYVFSSHWDREWYRPLQVFRYELVELFDRVLDALASGELAGPFFTDGQCVQLEDYLEIRPERREELGRALRRGDIVSGPWYTLADELLVSGESLIRNLRLGRERVRALGAEPSDAGFLCDLFGHNSQMPGILAAFDIPAAYLWRGINLHATRNFLWTGADGTQLPCHRFGTNGYWGYAVNVGQFTDHAEARPRVEDGVPAYHRRLREYLAAEAARTPIDAVLLFDGPDHNGLDAATYGLLKENLGEIEAGGERFALRHVGLDEHQRAVVDQAARITERKQGELRAFGTEPIGIDQQWLTGGTSASRVWIKQQNCRCQALLCHWAEPWGFLAEGVRGRPEAPGFMDHAWATLMKNHPHDSICGCSIDDVHRDMAGRFRQVEQLALKSTRASLAGIAGGIDTAVGADEERLVLFNPLPRADDGVAEVDVEVPTGWPEAETFGIDEEPVTAFVLVDGGGERVPYQLLSQRRDAKRVFRLPARNPKQERCHRVRVALRAGLPPLGWRALAVRAVPADEPAPGRRLGRGLATGAASIDNGRLRVSVGNDGTLAVLDHASGEAYRGLLGLEDNGDAGDGWHHEAPVNDRLIGSLGAPFSVALVEDGPLQATLEVTTRLRVPASLQRHGLTRSPRTVELPVTQRVTVRGGEACVRVRCTVENTAEDHRLRVLFPTGADVDRYAVDSPFDAVERPVGVAADAAGWRETAYEVGPQQSWTAAWDGRRGLAVVTAGLMETCVRDLPDRPIALTLFRSNRRTPFSEGEPDGQLPGAMGFGFSIHPLSAAPDPVGLTEAGQRLNAGAQAVQKQGVHAGFWHRPAGLAAAGSAAELRGAVVLSSLRRVGDGIEARLFNPAGEPAAFSLSLHPPARGPLATAQRVNGESRPLEEPHTLRDGVLHATLAAKAFETFRFGSPA